MKLIREQDVRPVTIWVIKAGIVAAAIILGTGAISIISNL